MFPVTLAVRGLYVGPASLRVLDMGVLSTLSPTCILLSFVLFYILGSSLLHLILLPKLFQFCHCVDSVFPAIVGLFLVLSHFFDANLLCYYFAVLVPRQEMYVSHFSRVLLSFHSRTDLEMKIGH